VTGLVHASYSYLLWPVKGFEVDVTGATPNDIDEYRESNKDDMSDALT
jgi:hypothetical protein